MNAPERSVKEHPFFQGMEAAHLETVQECATEVRFRPEECIFREGEEADALYLIREGSVALEAFHLEQGSIVIQTLGAGDVLGWSWLMPPYRWRFDARALAPTSAYALDGRRLRASCEASPGLGYALLQRLATVLEQRLQATRMHLLDTYSVRH